MTLNRTIFSISVGVMAVVFVFIIKTDLGDAIGVGAPFLLFLSAIMLSTWYGGLVAGVISVFLSSLVCLFFYLPPYNSFEVNNTSTLLQLAVFLFEGFTISYFIHSYNKKHSDQELLKRKSNTMLIESFRVAFSQKSTKYIVVLFFMSYYIFVLRLFINQVPDMSFVDAFNNYIGGYFMSKGKILYSQIFFNHQMLMPYISYGIQVVTHPATLTRLVAYHRLFVMLFSTAADIFLIWRFRLTGLGFVLFYELSDFYLFGNFFLGEALLVYPAVYLFGLVWEKIYKHPPKQYDLLLAGVSTWAIIFLRETFIPLALFLYAILLWNRKFSKMLVFSIVLFLALCIVTVLSVPFKEYYFQLITTNLINNIPSEITKNNLNGVGILYVFFYPLALFGPGVWNFFRFDLIGLDSIFLISFFILVVKLKQKKGPLLIFFTLALAAIRYVPPGTIFYGAFHILPWFGLFIMSLFLMLSEIYNVGRLKVTLNFLLVTMICVFGFLVLTFRWFSTSSETFQEKFDRNYGRYFAHGKAIQVLATKNATLFVDGWDSLIFWVASIPSSYKYTLYYPVMTHISEFDTARNDMFHNYPPDFYYVDCERDPVNLPGFIVPSYVRLLHNNTSGCIFVMKKDLVKLSPQQIAQLKTLGFRIPHLKN